MNLNKFNKTITNVKRHELFVIVLPLNIVGVFLFSKIRQDVSIKWRMPHFSTQMISVGLATSEQIFLKQLLNSDGNYQARILERAACVSARVGLFDFTLAAMDTLSKRIEVPPSIGKQARRYVQFEQAILDRIIQNLSYTNQIWKLSHVPAWVIPPLIKQMSHLVKKRRIIIYSAGHKLLRKNLKWEWKRPHLQAFPHEEIPYSTRYLE